MKKTKLWATALSLLSILFFTACSDSDDEKKHQHDDPETIKVGAMLSLTGNWSTLGIASQAALEIALEDINQYMEDRGSYHRFAVEVYDTKLEASKALEFMETANNEGIRYVIGPQSSSEVDAVKSYADNNGMFVVSHGSTAGSLSLPNDNIFRFCPDGKLEGEALAKAIYDSGARGLVTVSLDDVGNTALVSDINTAFTALGGEIYPVDPYEPGITDFTSVITSIENKLNSSMTAHTTSGSAVYIAAFDEGADLFAQAENNSLLTSVHWYGGDGITKSEAYLNNLSAAAFAEATDFFAPAFGLPSAAKSKWEPLLAEIESQTGVSAGAFALAAYDALWVIALTYDATETTGHDEESTREMFYKKAGMYFGATGSTQLNDNGDRATAIFDFWGIVQENGDYTWKFVGSSQ